MVIGTVNSTVCRGFDDAMKVPRSMRLIEIISRKKETKRNEQELLLLVVYVSSCFPGLCKREWNTELAKCGREKRGIGGRRRGGGLFAPEGIQKQTQTYIRMNTLNQPSSRLISSHRDSRVIAVFFFCYHVRFRVSIPVWLSSFSNLWPVSDSTPFPFFVDIAEQNKNARPQSRSSNPRELSV